MPIPTEPIGSIPRPLQLLDAVMATPQTAEVDALRPTISRIEETGSPVVTDGEQTKPDPVSNLLAIAVTLS